MAGAPVFRLDVKDAVADADVLIVKGYAEGSLSRPYSDDEIKALRGPTQTVAI